MKNIILLCTLLLSTLLSFSQEIWDYLPIEIPSNQHGAIFPFDENIVHVVSDGGIFHKTEDGGLTWIELNSGVDEIFFDLTFESPILGYATGTNGIILKSSNAGQTWISLLSNTTENLYSLAINSPGSIWIVGDNKIVLHSIDNGNSWETIDLPTTVRLNSIRFKNENEGYIAGNNGKLYYTQNGGIDWEQLSIPETMDLFSISLTEDYIYLLAGEVSDYADEYTNSGILVYKSNNNIDWDVYELNQMEYGPADVFFTDESTEYSINSAALLCDCCFVRIEKTMNGGETWEYSLNEETNAADCNANRGYAKIAFASEQVGYILLGPRILKTPYQNTSGINDIKMEQAFTIYPNPSKEGQFNIKINSSNLDGLSMEIININGKTIYRDENLKTNNTFSLPTISESVYFVNLLKNGRVLSSQKLIGGL